MPVISANFETRREAELAIEHLVQEQELDRGDIGIESASDDNSAGVSASGADLENDFDDSDDEDAALNGAIKVTITIEDADLAEDVVDILHEFGASDVLQE